MNAKVKLTKGVRPGRGFSLDEIRGAGLRVAQLKRKGLKIDRRRRSSHQLNVAELKKLFAPRRKKAVKKKGKGKS